MKVCVVGDLHGNVSRLKEILSEYEGKCDKFVFLGDLVDRGPDSPGVVRIVMDRVSNHGDIMVIGNHDFKFAERAEKYLDEGAVEFRPDQKSTFEQFKNYQSLLEEYVKFVRKSPLWYSIGNCVFVHGGATPEMVLLSPPCIDDYGTFKKFMKKVPQSNIALYGESSGMTAEGLPIRTYGWLDAMPSWIRVYFGHDGHGYDSPRTMNGDAGCTAVCVDHENVGAILVECGVIDGKTSNNRLYIMVGPSGSGKSTWIKNNLPNCKVVSSDEIRQELFGDFRDQSDNRRVFHTLQNRVSHLLMEGHDVVIDATNLNKHERIRNVCLADPRTTSVTYVVIDRPIGEKKATAGWRPDWLIVKHHSKFMNIVKDLKNGDPEVASVYDFNVIWHVDS